MTIAEGVLRVFTDIRQCPIVDQAAGRCSSPATHLAKVGERFGVGSYTKVCLYHADMIEDD